MVTLYNIGINTVMNKQLACHRIVRFLSIRGLRREQIKLYTIFLNPKHHQNNTAVFWWKVFFSVANKHKIYIWFKCENGCELLILSGTKTNCLNATVLIIQYIFVTNIS